MFHLVKLKNIKNSVQITNNFIFPLLILISFTAGKKLPHNLNVTCDFDLVNHGINQNDLLEMLPVKCKNITNNEDDHKEYDQALEESKQFEKFSKLLSEYERRLDPDFNKTDPEQIPQKQWKFRRELYTKINPNECNNDTRIYYECMVSKRKEMIEYMETKLNT